MRDTYLCKLRFGIVGTSYLQIKINNGLNISYDRCLTFGVISHLVAEIRSSSAKVEDVEEFSHSTVSFKIFLYCTFIVVGVLDSVTVASCDSTVDDRSSSWTVAFISFVLCLKHERNNGIRRTRFKHLQTDFLQVRTADNILLNDGCIVRSFDWFRKS